ncbi:MAG: chromate efflux transporter [Alphaproteobacteria bacterium]|nr:chromate efflux transporter [Alphaproteobacteria bacterium]
MDVSRMPDASAGFVPAPSFNEALRFWFKLGWISFGGPAGQIAIMQTELVDRRRWIDQRLFLSGLNFCTLLPGPEAMQLATYIGWRLHGLKGGIVAGSLFVLPGAAIMLLLSWLAAAYGDVPLVASLFYGLKPVVIAIIAGAVWRIGNRALKGWPAVAIAAAAFVAIYFAGIDFPWIVLAAGLIGWVAGLQGSTVFASGHGHDKAEDSAVNGIAVAPVERPMFRLVGMSAIFVALLIVPIALALLLFGAEPFADVANLFTKAAFVTFGGAYAVLPYVAEEAVNTYGWLTADEMLNGLALAETRPGPLILVLQYVGFFAGWKFPGALAPESAAILAAAIATYCTFLPSFWFVLSAAPWIHSIHESAKLSSALGAITAAVVGVILNLGVFLAGGVILPGGRPDLFAVIVALAAFGVMIRWKPEIHWLVAGGATAGLIYRLVIGG